MRPRIDVVTLGVGDLERSTGFYRDGLGLPLRGMFGNDADHSTVAFFDLDGGRILALYPVEWLAADAGMDRGDMQGGGFSLGQLVADRAEVDRVIDAARRAGATVPEPPQQRVWGGYSGYFRDPDGHLWEIVWNPDMPVV